MTELFGYARLIGIAVVAILGAWLWVTVQGWRDDSRALATVKAEAAREVAQARQAVAALKAAQERSQAASRGLQDELQKLRAARRPAGVIRVCKPPRVPGDSASPRRDGSGPSGGVVPQPVEFDPGPLYDLADRADELSAQLRACQALLR